MRKRLEINPLLPLLSHDEPSWAQCFLGLMVLVIHQSDPLAAL